MTLFTQRLIGDHDRAGQSLKKALTFKDAITLHQNCGAFLFFLAKLEEVAPAGQFKEMKEGLLAQFMSGHVDADLSHTLENFVPLNADPKGISVFRQGKVEQCWKYFEIMCQAPPFRLFVMSTIELNSFQLCPPAFRPIISNIEKGKTEEKEQAALALAKQVATANLAQVKQQIELDVQALRDKLPGKAHEQAEHALDLKYLRDRQRKLGGNLHGCISIISWSSCGRMPCS